MTPTLAAVFAVISALAAMTTVVSFFNVRRRDAMEEGKRQARLEDLRRDVERAQERVRDLEDRVAERDVNVGQIVTSLDHVLKAVERIEAKLDKHLDAHVTEAGS